jgi:hypothetical protein
MSCKIIDNDVGNGLCDTGRGFTNCTDRTNYTFECLQERSQNCEERLIASSFFNNTHQLDTLHFHFHFFKTESLDKFRVSLAHPQ